MKARSSSESVPKILEPIPHSRGVEIIFEEKNHIYTNAVTGEIYTSVSHVIGKYKNFDREGVSKRTADKRGISVEDVLAEWNGKRDNSAIYGTRFHLAMEMLDRQNIVLPENEDIKDLLLKTRQLLSFNKTQWCEQIFASEKFSVCGTADKPTKRYNGLLDIFDYKTNTEKGIEFMNKYNTFMKEPFEHLEDCNYMHYTMQLSIYAYIAETEYNQRIGRLGIIDVSNGKIPIMVPVAYMRNEAEQMLYLHAA